MIRAIQSLIVPACLAVTLSCSLLGGSEIEFDNVERQSRQFIEWYQTIRLTPEQEAVKKTALEGLPAPCCSDKSAYTCCCECNVSRTIWGLSQYLIARQGAGVAQVQAKVKEWIAFVNPKGFSGVSCYNGGCARPFSKDGCGGMHASRLAL
jgi:hypothetical protein